MEFEPWYYIGGSIILTAGFVCAFFLTLREWRTYLRIRKTGHLVKGKIVGFKEDKSGDGVSYPAEVDYKTLADERIIATAQHSTGVKPTIGNEVWVVYNPDDPSHFYLQNSDLHIVLPVVVIAFGVGVIMSIVGFFELVWPYLSKHY